MLHFLVYRGDEAFCSEKCRTEQMDMDESVETVEHRQHLRAKSSVSYNRGVFSIQKRPTIANLTACGLIGLQNSVYATNTTFMEPWKWFLLHVAMILK
jgi:zinc-finger of the FCS-type, C2-C2